MRKGSSATPGFVVFFDIDARAELCRVDRSAVQICPRIGEQVDYRTDTEQGGGLYLVVNVRHVMDRSSDGPVLSDVVVDLQPMHSTVEEQISAVAVEIPISETAPTV